MSEYVYPEESEPLAEEADDPKTRFVVHDADRAWFVEAGDVDLFAVSARAGIPHGAYHHLLRVREGQALFGIVPDPSLALAVVAKLGPETRLRPASLTRFREAALGAAPDYVALLEEWITRFALLTGGTVTPKDFAIVRSGEEVRTADEAQVLLPDVDVVWLEQLEGAAYLLGQRDIPASDNGTWYPISQSAWIEMQANSRVRGFSSIACLQRDPRFEALQAFHQNVLRCVVVRLREHQARDQERLRLRTEADAETVKRAFLDLASPLAGRRTTTEATPDAFETPLMRACHAIGRTLGVTMRQHPDMLQGVKAKDAVMSIARASGVRVRRIAMREGWWRHAAGPLLVFREEDHHPMAVLPHGGKRLRIVDPSAPDPAPVPLTPETAATLNPFGYSFYRPFPAHALSYRDLLAFGFEGTRSELLTIVLLGSASGVLALATPMAMRVVFDSAIPGANRSELALIGGLLVAAAVVAALFNLTKNLIVLRLQGRVGADLQAAVWDRLLRLPVPFFREYASGDLAMRSMGISQMRQVLTGTTLNALLSGVFSIFSFALLFYYSPPLAALCTALTGVAVAATVAVGYRQLRWTRESYAQWGVIHGSVLEFITGIGKLRVAGATTRAFARWVREFARQKTTDLKLRRAALVLTVLNSVYLVICLAVIFHAHARLSAGGRAPMTTGEFLAFIAAFTQFMSSTLSLGAAVVSIIMVVPLYERAEPILRTRPETDVARPSGGTLTGWIDVSHLMFRYGANTPLVLRDVTFTIESGQYVAFVGPSGCGKSTLFRLLLGFEHPESGAVYYDGQDLATLDASEVRRQIGVVLQSGTLIAGSIFDNIRGASPITLDQAWEAATLAGLADDIHAMPMGMYTMVSEGGGGFSGGQRQRMLIARALVHRPRILLFDEATSALDNLTQAIVSESLRALKASRIVIAHRLSTIIAADCIYVMDGGRIVQRGTYDELLHQDGLFRELAGRQLT